MDEILLILSFEYKLLLLVRKVGKNSLFFTRNSPIFLVSVFLKDFVVFLALLC
jgi:hypothetical protein